MNANLVSAVPSEINKTALPKYMPRKVDDLDAAFGGSAMKILPPMNKIPDEFMSFRNPWVKWQIDWFHKGLDHCPEPRAGIDMNLAMVNLACVQRSFEPKHEHKQAGVAYLASLWFTSPDGEPNDTKDAA